MHTGMVKLRFINKNKYHNTQSLVLQRFRHSFVEPIIAKAYELYVATINSIDELLVHIFRTNNDG